MKMLKLISLSFIALITFAASASADLVRTSASAALFQSYNTPRLNGNDAASSDYYTDKFIHTSTGAAESLEVTYTTTDPILIVTVLGAQIVTYERTNNGNNIRIVFSVPQKISGTQTEIFIDLLPAGLVDDEDDRELVTALTGAWSDSLIARASILPFFSDEDFDGIYISFRQFIGFGDDTFRFFIPNAALEIVNKDKPLPIAKLRIRKVVNGVITNYFDSKQAVGDGVLITIGNTYQTTDELAHISLSALGAAGLYAPKKSARNFSFNLIGIVPSCVDGQFITIFKQTATDSTPKRLKKITLNSCEASINTKIKEDTTFSFKLGKKTYKRTVKLGA